ncbi:hypothetical protein [Microbacterium sp. 13-71-7]|jgi:hypothetical protein|uniref:hypothetical protein n=1 Tax=Microbacterium sp. 13-71-7 TaxID=1970399 RepID=UPI000BD5D83B|nr:hypothetical protein [Microbacterium sp. 13-71-7]OZB85402.1 MAG: hypothetical protein B7X32_03675 [Microbacterium sp. 13-71-7]
MTTSVQLDREALVAFMRGVNPILHEPLSTAVAEEWADRFEAQFRARTVEPDARGAQDAETFTASNGVVVSASPRGLSLRDRNASNSESRIMTIQARKAEALREYFVKAAPNRPAGGFVAAVATWFERHNGTDLSPSDWWALETFIDIAQSTTATGESAWANTLSYAATALEASADNGDRYCARQIREHLATTGARK